jgi:2-oxoglutarate ferredoxin oxidoreductase subunit alpha
VGGLEKEDGTGNISYDPENHERMCRLRAEKVARVAHTIPPVTVRGDEDAELLVLGWGSTWGAITAAVNTARRDGLRVAQAHLVHLNPFPSNLGEVLARYEKILVPEMNLGQLSRLIRAEFLAPAQAVTKIQGLPFTVTELVGAIRGALGK